MTTHYVGHTLRGMATSSGNQKRGRQFPVTEGIPYEMRRKFFQAGRRFLLILSRLENLG